MHLLIHFFRFCYIHSPDFIPSEAHSNCVNGWSFVQIELAFAPLWHKSLFQANRLSFVLNAGCLTAVPPEYAMLDTVEAGPSLDAVH